MEIMEWNHSFVEITFDSCRVRGWQVTTFFFIKCWFCGGTVVSVKKNFCFVGKLRTNTERERDRDRKREAYNKRGIKVQRFFWTVSLHALVSFLSKSSMLQFFFFFKGRPLIICFLTNETKCGQNSNVIFFLWATCEFWLSFNLYIWKVLLLALFFMVRVLFDDFFFLSREYGIHFQNSKDFVISTNQKKNCYDFMSFLLYNAYIKLLA